MLGQVIRACFPYLPTLREFLYEQTQLDNFNNLVVQSLSLLYCQSEPELGEKKIVPLVSPCLADLEVTR